MRRTSPCLRAPSKMQAPPKDPSPAPRRGVRRLPRDAPMGGHCVTTQNSSRRLLCSSTARQRLRVRLRGRRPGAKEGLAFLVSLVVLQARGGGATRTGLRREIELLLTPEEKTILDQHETPDVARISSSKWHPLHNYACILLLWSFSRCVEWLGAMESRMDQYEVMEQIGRLWCCHPRQPQDRKRSMC